MHLDTTCGSQLPKGLLATVHLGATSGTRKIGQTAVCHKHLNDSPWLTLGTYGSKDITDNHFIAKLHNSIYKWLSPTQI